MNRRVFGMTVGAAAVATLYLLADRPSITEPRRLHDGRGPSLLARTDGTLGLLYSKPRASGGADLYFASAAFDGSPLRGEIRINDTPGEVRDGGENGPILLQSPEGHHLYAVWNSVDSRHKMANRMRFSRLARGASEWSPAITMNDDAAPSTHTFQGATVGEDGTIYAAWLDRRDADDASTDGYPVGGVRSVPKNRSETVSLYLSRSTNGGRSFDKNIRVAPDACPCCRVALGATQGKVVIAWRSVTSGNIRDISTAVSEDRGKTWTAPRLVAKEGWKINACPHVGASIAAGNNGKLFVAWVTRADPHPGVYVAVSSDGGRSFTPRQHASASFSGANHPFVTAAQDGALVVFQTENGIKARVVRADGTVGELKQITARAEATYPSAAVASGSTAIAWTETLPEKSAGYLLIK